MFNRAAKKRIWDNVNISETGIIKDEIEIPSLERIYETSIERLKEIGYSGIVWMPKKPNCIIRTYCGEEEYEGCRYWLWGTEVYLKTPLGMISSSGKKSYCEFKIKIWTCQDKDDYFLVKPTKYIDDFLKIF